MKRILFVVVCFTGVLSVKSQAIDRCQAFNYFLASDSARSMLAFSSNKISWLHDADDQLGKDNCSTGYDGNHSFKWIGDSAMARPLKAKNCAYYYVSCTRKGAGWFIEITQACSGLVCQGLVSKNKQKVTASSFLAFVR